MQFEGEWVGGGGGLYCTRGGGGLGPKGLGAKNNPKNFFCRIGEFVELCGICCSQTSLGLGGKRGVGRPSSFQFFYSSTTGGRAGGRGVDGCPALTHVEDLQRHHHNPLCWPSKRSEGKAGPSFRTPNVSSIQSGTPRALHHCPPSGTLRRLSSFPLDHCKGRNPTRNRKGLRQGLQGGDDPPPDKARKQQTLAKHSTRS